MQHWVSTRKTFENVQLKIFFIYISTSTSFLLSSMENLLLHNGNCENNLPSNYNSICESKPHASKPHKPQTNYFEYFSKYRWCHSWKIQSSSFRNQIDNVYKTKTKLWMYLYVINFFFDSWKGKVSVLLKCISCFFFWWKHILPKKKEYQLRNVLRTIPWLHLDLKLCTNIRRVSTKETRKVLSN